MKAVAKAALVPAFVVHLLFLGQAMSQSEEGAPTLEFVLDAIDAASAQLESLEVTGDSYATDGLSDIGLESMSPIVVVEHRVSGSKRYWARKVFSNGEQITDELTSFDGKEYRSLSRHDDIRGAIGPGRPQGYQADRIAAPMHTPIWDVPFDERLAKDRELLRLLPDRADIDGKLCYVLEGTALEAPESMAYRVYVDPEIGFMARQIEEIRTVEPREVARRMKLMNYEEASPGVWVARRLEEVGFQYGEIFGRNFHLIKSFQPNISIPEEQMNVEFPPGTLVLDLVRDIRYVVNDPFSNVIDHDNTLPTLPASQGADQTDLTASGGAAADAAPLRYSDTTTSPYWKFLTLSAIAGIALLAAGLAAAHYKARRTSG